MNSCESKRLVSGFRFRLGVLLCRFRRLSSKDGARVPDMHPPAGERLLLATDNVNVSTTQLDQRVTNAFRCITMLCSLSATQLIQIAANVVNVMATKQRTALLLAHIQVFLVMGFVTHVKTTQLARDVNFVIRRSIVILTTSGLMGPKIPQVPLLAFPAGVMVPERSTGLQLRAPNSLPTSHRWRNSDYAAANPIPLAERVINARPRRTA